MLRYPARVVRAGFIRALLPMQSQDSVPPISLHDLRLTLVRAGRLFRDIDGQQRAAAFAYYAIFSLLPMAVLLVTIATCVVDEQTAAREVVGFLDYYLPVSGETKRIVTDSIGAVIKARGRTGTAAFLIVAWTALLIFKALIRATNRAWNCEIHKWWRLPLKSLLILWHKKLSASRPGGHY